MSYPEPLAPALSEPTSWTPDDAADLYRVHAWSDGYFSVNDEGHVAVQPAGPEGDQPSIDLYRVFRDLHEQGLQAPLLIRFQDILHARVVQLNEAFRRAIDTLGYENRYTSVYPIKVNQLHEVVEEVLDAGAPYGLGLECGSKAELVATLAHLKSDDTLLICNGYKDTAMQELILTGQQLGKSVVPVIEKYTEFERFIALAQTMDVRPQFGVRINLSMSGVGRWASSSGDQSKFGVSIPELVRMLDRLGDEGLDEALILLHFHLGSQIADIQTLKGAVKEVTRIYAQLVQRGLPVRYLDVGGGLGVNYEAATNGQRDSIGYSLQEYANSVVYAAQEVCQAEGVPPPHLLSESGRALTAHHSVLVVEAIGSYGKAGIADDFDIEAFDQPVVRDLHDTLQLVRSGSSPVGETRPAVLLEAYHDAVEKRQQAGTLFSLGYLPLEARAATESLFWTICRLVHDEIVQIEDEDDVPSELYAIGDLLTEQYLCDFSVFQSILDYWAIGQRFPIMPIHRLDEAPDRRGILVDLTCDSDGAVGRFISVDGEKRALELHTLRAGEPYFLGFFLTGAYQDIMGDMHNLFGRLTEVHVYADSDEPGGYYVEKMIPGATVQEMLAQVQYFPNDLHRRMQTIIRQKVQQGVIRPRTGVTLLERYDRMFQHHTYLNPPEGERSA